MNTLSTWVALDSFRTKAVLMGFLAVFLSLNLVEAAASFSLMPEPAITRQVYLMGTELSLQIRTSNRERGIKQLGSFISIVETTEAELSTWRTDSVLSKLNAAQVGFPFSLGEKECMLFRELIRWEGLTNGAFDFAIGRLIEAYDLRGKGRIPNDDDLLWARQNSGLSQLDFSASDCVARKKADVWIDAGAFGKGEALDRVRQFAGIGERRGWKLDLGGQIAVSSGQEAIPWMVALSDPYDREKIVITLGLSGGSLATSGSFHRDKRTGQYRISHILDPRTGLPAKFVGSVSVWHESSLVSDILSTALFVLGPEEGLELARGMGLAACYLYRENQSGIQIRMTPLFESLVSDKEPPD